MRPDVRSVGQPLSRLHLPAVPVNNTAPPEQTKTVRPCWDERSWFGLDSAQMPSFRRISVGMAFLLTITDMVLYSTNGREK